jgi:AraC-like DNA-binding protein
MTDLIRSACLTHYPELARAVGIDPLAMLRQVRLPLGCLAHQNMRIAVPKVRRLLEATAMAAGVDEFGLRMAERGGLSNLGPVALIIRDQPTVGSALESLSRYIHIHHEGMRLAIEPHGDIVIVVLFLRGGRPRVPRQSVEMALGTVHGVIRSLFGGEWRPLEVHLMNPPPRNRAYYRKFFRCDVAFNSEFDAIMFPARDLERKIPTAHPLIARYVESRVDEFDAQHNGWDGKIGQLIRMLLPAGGCSIERVADHLACNRRTIHRRLADCGTTFSEVLDTQRADLVMHLIKDRSRSLAEISVMIGFSAQSAMARWFRERFGCSISEWRADPRERMRLAASRR